MFFLNPAQKKLGSCVEETNRAWALLHKSEKTLEISRKTVQIYPHPFVFKWAVKGKKPTGNIRAVQAKTQEEKVTMNVRESEWWEAERGGSQDQNGEKEGGVASRHQKLFGAVILFSAPGQQSPPFGQQNNIWGREMEQTEHRKRRFAFFRFCTCGTDHERATDTKWGTKRRGGCVDEGTITDIPGTLNNLSAQTLKQLHSVTFVYKPLERAGWPAHIPLLVLKWQEAFIVSGRVH